jgi:hypothetical protein
VEQKELSIFGGEQVNLQRHGLVGTPEHRLLERRPSILRGRLKRLAVDDHVRLAPARILAEEWRSTSADNSGHDTHEHNTHRARTCSSQVPPTRVRSHDGSPSKMSQPIP